MENWLEEGAMQECYLGCSQEEDLMPKCTNSHVTEPCPSVSASVQSALEEGGGSLAQEICLSSAAWR